MKAIGDVNVLMNKKLKEIIDEIDNKYRSLIIDFSDVSWRNDIPSEAGWYLIKTDMPVKVLESVESPQYKAHINIPQTIESTLPLQELGIAIIQDRDEQYVVYNGEAKNLKARAREHENGHPKTYCLGLANYPILRMYNWTFCYATVSEYFTSNSDDKSIRLAIEQAWRGQHGWPILCSR